MRGGFDILRVYAVSVGERRGVIRNIRISSSGQSDMKMMPLMVLVFIRVNLRRELAEFYKYILTSHSNLQFLVFIKFCLAFACFAHCNSIINYAYDFSLY